MFGSLILCFICCWFLFCVQLYVSEPNQYRRIMYTYPRFISFWWKCCVSITKSSKFITLSSFFRLKSILSMKQYNYKKKSLYWQHKAKMRHWWMEGFPDPNRKTTVYNRIDEYRWMCGLCKCAIKNITKKKPTWSYNSKGLVKVPLYWWLIKTLRLPKCCVHGHPHILCVKWIDVKR